MLTTVYVKIGDKKPHEIIALVEEVIAGTVMSYTLEGELMGMRIYHDEPENFQAVDDVDLIFPEYDEDDYYYRDDDA